MHSPRIKYRSLITEYNGKAAQLEKNPLRQRLNRLFSTISPQCQNRLRAIASAAYSYYANASTFAAPRFDTYPHEPIRRNCRPRSYLQRKHNYAKQNIKLHVLPIYISTQQFRITVSQAYPSAQSMQCRPLTCSTPGVSSYTVPVTPHPGLTHIIVILSSIVCGKIR